MSDVGHLRAQVTRLRDAAATEMTRARCAGDREGMETWLRHVRKLGEAAATLAEPGESYAKWLDAGAAPWLGCRGTKYWLPKGKWDAMNADERNKHREERRPMFEKDEEAQQQFAEFERERLADEYRDMREAYADWLERCRERDYDAFGYAGGDMDERNNEMSDDFKALWAEQKEEKNRKNYGRTSNNSKEVHGDSWDNARSGAGHGDTGADRNGHGDGNGDGNQERERHGDGRRDGHRDRDCNSDRRRPGGRRAMTWAPQKKQ